MILSVDNNLDQLPQTLYSFTNGNLSSGGTAILIKNPNAFTNQYAVQLGKTGEEQSEIAVINTPTALLLPLNGGGTLLYDHPNDTPVFQIHYNKIIFKRSITGTVGTASAIATVTITPDSAFTEYNDTTGAVTYAYKTQFYNSVSSDLSSESDWFVPSGPSFYSLQKLRDRSRKALYNSTYITDDTVIDDWVNEWTEEMTNAAIKVNKGYSIGTASYGFGTSGYGSITEPGFKKADKIEITYSGVTWTKTSEVPMNRYSESDFFNPLSPLHSWEGDTVFRILPFGQAGTARFSFSQLSTQLVDDTDELPFPLRSYTTGCIEYVLYRAYDNDNKDAQADKHYDRFLKKVMDFTHEMTPRDATGPQTISFVDGLSGLNDDPTLTGEFI